MNESIWKLADGFNHGMEIEYQEGAIAYESTDDGIVLDTRRASLNRAHKNGNQRFFSEFWQSRGIQIEDICALQFCRFLVGGEIEVCGRDIFLRKYEIDPATIWALVANSRNSDYFVVAESDCGKLTCWKTETGKRTNGGHAKRKVTEAKKYKRNRRPLY